MLERAIMLRARALLLQESHSARVLTVAIASSHVTWNTAVLDIQHRCDLRRPIPCITLTLSTVQITDALQCKAARKLYLSCYRRLHVVPVLQGYDDDAFSVAAAGTNWLYLELQASALPFPESLIDPDRGPATWYLYCAWAVIHVLGRWPMAVFGGEGLPSTIPVCPLCGTGSVSVVHILHACPGTLDLYISSCSTLGDIFTSGDRLLGAPPFRFIR